MIAKWIFGAAGIYGIVVLAAGYAQILSGAAGEPALGVTHLIALANPDLVHGFFGVAFAWQIAFLLIARDPVRLRPIMLAAMVEKLSFVMPTYLYAVGRVDNPLFLVDAVWLMLFIAAYIRTPSSPPVARTE